MSDLSFEIIAKLFRENFHPAEVTVTLRKRTDSEGFSIMLTENESGKQKEFLTGRSTTVNDLQDMVITAARLFGYTWATGSVAGEPA